ncbi:MAG: M3 family oligoendopeptidase [Pirellulaceae bacterium]
MSQLHFDQITAPAPDFPQYAKQHAECEAALEGAATPEAQIEAVGTWDALRRTRETRDALVELRFNQDTRNEQYKRDRDLADELRPKFTELDVRMKRKLVESPHRAEFEAHFGPQALALWEAEITTYDPVIEHDMVQEAKLGAEYTELLAAAQFEFEGDSYNLSGLGKFREDPRRDVRRTTETMRWQWFADNRDMLDRVFDQQVRLRHAMAGKLGFDDYIGLGYKKMCRVDYDRDDVDNFRAAVREDVVPLAVELRKAQAAALGVDRLMFWDEFLFDPQGNPAPLGDHDWMLARAQEMFDAMGGGLGDFFRQMNEGGFLDLKNRDGKAGGGFCTSFPSYGFPYIFANFNGTKGDVEVFTHEIGHAFQCYESRGQQLFEYLWPTYESCEIHSMGLEFLTWPQMEKFFGDAAERFRRIHLTQSLLFLPYGVAVDHFQHLVYASPSASPAQRHAMWQEMERTYLPWRDYGGIPHACDGGIWQLQRHIYLSPFYYIDYTLALTCALQFWVRSQQDANATMRDYVALCRRGGEAPFQELAKSAGLTSPFEKGCLRQVVSQARQVLQL